MAENIVPFSISAPGFNGLNLSDSPVDLPANFALEANNCIIDKSGRIASRKGWEAVSTSNADLSTNDITCIGEVIQTDGTATTVCTGGGYLFKLVGTTLTKLTYGGGGVAPTISLNNWQFCQLSGVGIFWQRGYDPLIYDPAVSTTTFRRLNEKSGTSGTVYQCNTAISAFGRIWAADTSTDKGTLVYSDILSPHVWNTGTAGSLDVRNVWPKGGDEIVALAAHNNFLFIFGRKQVLIYKDAATPASMSLYDTITGVGCISRDTVQITGDDVWFLSDIGVISLMRTIQEKSAPIRQISKNIHDTLRSYLAVETIENIKSGYSAVNNFYLLTFPTSSVTFCIDTRVILQDGSGRATTWSGTTPKAFCEAKNRKFYTGRAGYLGNYAGYSDNGSVFRMSYYTTWIDFGNPVQKSILKKILLTAIGGTSQTVVFKWAYDFSSNYFSESTQLSAATASAEYGSAEYGIAEYSGNLAVNTLSVNGSSSGRVLQFGFEAQISSVGLSIQKIDLFTKDGRL